MRSAFLSAAVAGLLSISGVQAVPNNLCGDAPATKPDPLAGPAWTLGRWKYGDGTSCDTRWDAGLTVTGFTAWKTAWQIKAMQFTYSDGTKSGIMGNNGKVPDSGGKSISWKEGEQISNFKLWNNRGAYRQGRGSDALGRISFSTSKSGDFDLDCGETSGDPNTIDVGSGLWLGAGWMADDMVRDVQPLFLGTNQEVTMDSIEWPKDIDEQLKKMQGLASLDTTTAYIRNLNKDCDPKNCSASWSWTPTISKTSSASFSNLEQNTFGVSVSIGADFKLGVPGTMESTLKTNFETSFSRMKQSSQDKSMTWTQSSSPVQGSTPTANLIPPQMAMNCTVSTQMGKFSSDYTAKLNVRVNNSNFKINIPGHFDGTTYGSIDSGCALVDLNRIPKGADVTDAQKTVASKAATNKRAIAFKA